MKIILTILITSLVIFLVVLWLNYSTYNGIKKNNIQQQNNNDQSIEKRTE